MLQCDPDSGGVLQEVGLHPGIQDGDAQMAGQGGVWRILKMTCDLLGD